MGVTQPSGTTSLSLLQGMRERDPLKWKRFASIYTPLVYGWCRRAAVPEHEAADVAQEVFRAVAARIDTFRRDQPGDSFRGWLWGICRHKIKDHFRQRTRRPEAIGGSAVLEQLHNVPGDVPEGWGEGEQRDDAQLIFYRALELIQEEFETRTWQAFWQVVVQEQSPADAGADLGMTVGAVHNAKYKVLRRLRQEFDGLM
jgi:RNA polymerase sigma-70 factor (ECF subfamily)